MIDQYLQSLDAHLAQLAPNDRAEVVAEIRQHIVDAVNNGRTIADAIAALGPADALARAYELELLVAPSGAAPHAMPARRRLWRVLALLAVVSLPSLIVVVALGALAVSLTLSGLGLVLAGAADQAGALPSWIALQTEPWVAIVAGAVMMAAGGASAYGGVAYLRLVVRLVKSR